MLLEVSDEDCRQASVLLASMKQKVGNICSEEGATRREWVDLMTDCLFATLPCTRSNPDQMSPLIGSESPFYASLYHDCLNILTAAFHAVFFRSMTTLRGDGLGGGDNSADVPKLEVTLISTKGT